MFIRLVFVSVVETLSVGKRYSLQLIYQNAYLFCNTISCHYEIKKFVLQTLLYIPDNSCIMYLLLSYVGSTCSWRIQDRRRWLGLFVTSEGGKGGFTVPSHSWKIFEKTKPHSIMYRKQDMYTVYILFPVRNTFFCVLNRKKYPYDCLNTDTQKKVSLWLLGVQHSVISPDFIKPETQQTIIVIILITFSPYFLKELVEL